MSDLLQRARAAHMSKDFAAAERDYREIIKTVDPRSSAEADKTVFTAAYNLAVILEGQQKAYAAAANILECVRKTPDGKGRVHPQLHRFYAEMRGKQFDVLKDNFELGETNPTLTMVGARLAIAYTPSPLAALAQGIMANAVAAKQAVNDEQLRAEASRDVLTDAPRYAEFVGIVGLAATSPTLKAQRDKDVASGQIAPTSPLATFEYMYAEGREAEVMSAKNAALRGAATALSDADLRDLWHAWMATNKAQGMLFMKLLP